MYMPEDLKFIRRTKNISIWSGFVPPLTKFILESEKYKLALKLGKCTGESTEPDEDREKKHFHQAYAWRIRYKHLLHLQNFL